MPQTCLGAAVPGCLIRPGRWRVALLLGLAWSVGVSLGAQAATTWTVCASGCDYASIKAAIAAPTTLDGDTLAIAAGTYTEPGITVNKSLTLQGASAASTIVQAAGTEGAASTRVFTIPSGVTVTLQALTIRYGNSRLEGGGGIRNDGTLTVTASTIRDNRAPSCCRDAGGGGGIWNTGTLTLLKSTIHSNWTQYAGGGLANEGTLTTTASTVRNNSTSDFWGGGVFNDYQATLALIDTTVRDNSNTASSGFGGGLANAGTMTLTASTVSGNAVPAGYHGGLYNAGILTLSASTVSGNSATNGGGGLGNFGTLALIASTVSGNSSRSYSGGIANYGRVTLTASTVSGNTATSGGGLFNNGGRVTLTASTVSGNSAEHGGGLLNNTYSGFVTLTASLVADNPSGGDCDNINGASSFSQGYNVDSDGSCQLTASTDRPGTDPQLGPLQDNGGPTLTQALLPGSPAIDAIPWGANGCGTTLFSDQRWKARPQPAGGACDIGAYEVAVAGQALSAWVTGVTPHTAVCENATTGQAVTLNDPAIPWDCEAAGLGVTAGDQVALQVRGPVMKGATDVGGAVVGMAPRGGGCTNRTTGQQVTFQHMKGATAASCVAARLVVHPGDSVQMRVQGVAE